MPTATDLAVSHWDETPLFVSEEERYCQYPWLIAAGEFEKHAGEDVLEVGCGTGCDLLQFAKNGARATGIDVTPEHVRLARERVNGEARVVLAEATRIPFPDAGFDYVYSHGVLHHMDEPRRAVEEIFRVLRPGGRFNVMLYSRFSMTTIGRIVKYGRRWKDGIENSAAPVRIDLYTARSLRRLFQPAAIEVRKYECRHAPLLQSWLGWYIRATGARPAGLQS
jgi:ubiquinone/menaquinone biosynthesis C-methylase UbiE